MKLAKIQELTAQLQHEFNAPDILEQALTHPSGASASRADNQRLEFLGDRVLGLVIAEELSQAFPDAPEGELAPRFNALVRRETLAEIATEIDLGKHLRLGRSESISGGRRKSAILADALEAVIAALYLDGGLEAAQTFIRQFWSDRILSARTAPLDAKTRIQEWAQGRGFAPPAYDLVNQSGPDHAPVFHVAAHLGDSIRGEGKARSKKLAEQAAAEELLRQVASDD